MAENTKNKLEETAQSGSTEGIIDPPSPIRRHVKWKMARIKKIGQMTFEATKEIAEKVVRFFGGAGITGIVRPSWTLGCSDCRLWASRAPWSCPCSWSRCHHQAIFRIGSTNLQQLTQQIRDQLEESITEKVTQQLMASFSQMQSQFQSQMQSQGLALPPEPMAGPSGPRVITKESCCGLYIEANPPCLVALGRFYEGSTVHNIPLLPGQVKVGVEEVKDALAPVPVPTDEVTLLGQTLNTFLAWPTHLVKPLSKHETVSPTKPPQRVDPEVNDPLYMMILTILELFLKPFQVNWDATVFKVFNPDFPLYIKHKDLSKIAHGGQCLSISIIQLWILMRVGNSDVYGFLEPQSIQRFGQSQFESESHMKSLMQSSQCDIYLGAYLNG
ncbi:hypothetical protein GmHk_03G007327 [Glycine max]|nr:hypothetical protein GmHk_03G007327 [Glycine max]